MVLFPDDEGHAYDVPTAQLPLTKDQGGETANARARW